LVYNAKKVILDLEGSRPQVWQVNGMPGEEGLGLLVVDGGVDDDIVTLLPVDGRRDTVLVTNLERVDNPQDFVKVATSGGRIRNSQADDLLGVDDEHRSNGEGNTLGIDIGGVLMVQHVVQGGDLTFLVGDDGVVDTGWADLGAERLDILDPSVVLLEAIGRETDELHATISKVLGTTSDFTKLGGADGGKVIGMGEEDSPRVTDPFVELDWAGSGLSLEIRGDASKTQVRHGRSFFVADNPIVVVKERGFLQAQPSI